MIPPTPLLLRTRSSPGWPALPRTGCMPQSRPQPGRFLAPRTKAGWEGLLPLARAPVALGPLPRNTWVGAVGGRPGSPRKGTTLGERSSSGTGRPQSPGPSPLGGAAAPGGRAPGVRSPRRTPGVAPAPRRAAPSPPPRAGAPAAAERSGRPTRPDRPPARRRRWRQEAARAGLRPRGLRQSPRASSRAAGTEGARRAAGGRPGDAEPRRRRERRDRTGPAEVSARGGSGAPLWGTVRPGGRSRPGPPPREGAPRRGPSSGPGPWGPGAPAAGGGGPRGPAIGPRGSPPNLATPSQAARSLRGDRAAERVSAPGLQREGWRRGGRVCARARRTEGARGRAGGSVPAGQTPSPGESASELRQLRAGRGALPRCCPG